MSPSQEVPYGTLDLMVLKTLDGLGPLHGYGIARRIEQVTSGGLELNQGTIYPALLEAGLLDRLLILTFPVVLGGGKRLFGEATPARTMVMVDQKVTPSGVVIATYEPAGEVKTGWAGPQVDSARESERQKRMAEGSW